MRGVRYLGGRGDGRVEGDSDVRAVLLRERVVEGAVRVGEHAEREGGGGGAGEHHEADHDGLQPPAAQAAPCGPSG